MRFVAALSVLAFGALSFGQFSGLAAAPSMKTQGFRDLKFQYRQTSRGAAIDGRYRKNFQVLYGVTDSFEVGFSNDLDGRSMLGGKYTFYRDNERRFRFTAGVQDITEDPVFYVGGVKEFDGFEIHGGYIDASDGQLFVGYRRRIAEDFRFSVDHISGPSGRTSGRLDYYLDDHWSLDARVYFPNNTNRQRTHRFGIAYSIEIPE